jgi:hypothetical protein
MRVLWFAAMLLAAGRLEGQTWNDPATRALVERAILRRSRAEADTSLLSYRANGRGVVTFLAEIGSDRSGPARLLKGDELAVEVYWRRPDRSKQIIRAWRDSTFFPTGISYHRDHLGIVTDDFGPTIRIGGGDEVRDVVHPLAPDGPSRYDYAIRDTVSIRSPSGRLTLVSVAVRPKDPTLPAVVGAIDLEAERAILVRSRFTFTGAAYRDPDLEDIAVRLERALVEGRYWLPFHQEIELRRRVAAVEFPLRSVIRGRWDIDDYEVNAAVPDSGWRGAPIGGLRAPGGVGPWTAPLTRVVDSSLAFVDRSALETVRTAAAKLARQQLLDGLPRTRLRLGSVSELARVNRVQGLALGAGMVFGAGPGFDRATLGLGVGTADGRITGRVELERQFGSLRVTAGAGRSIEDLSELRVASGAGGSLAAQETGRDYGDYVLVERVGLGAERPIGSGGSLQLGLDREWAWSVATEATPARGHYRPNPALGSGAHWIGRARLSLVERDAGGRRLEGSIGAETGLGHPDFARLVAFGRTERRLLGGELSLAGWAGLGTNGLPARRSFVMGGRATLPGEPFRAFGGRRIVWASADWLLPLAGPAIPLGRLGHAPGDVWFGPIIAAGWAGGRVAGVPWQPAGIRPIVGFAAELFARTVRIEVGQAIRGGRGPGITIDLSRAWWGVL